MLGLPPHLQKGPYFPAKPSLTSRGVRHNYKGFLTSLNKPEFQMAIPAVTREYTPAACCNFRKHMRLHRRHKMRPDSLHCVLSSSVFTIKGLMNLDFPDGTKENPQEHCHKKRRIRMSPQECKIDLCTQINSR